MDTLIGRVRLRWLLFFAAGIALTTAITIIGITVRQTAAHQLERYIRVRDQRIAHQVSRELRRAVHDGGWPMMQQVAEQTAHQLGTGLIIHAARPQAMLRIPPTAGTLRAQNRVTVPLFSRRHRFLGTLTLVNPPSFEPRLSPVLLAIERALIAATVIALAVALGLSWWMGNFASKPMERLSRAARSVARGQREVQVPVDGTCEVRELAEDFNRMTHALSASERRQHQLVADVAHELRTPLSVLAGYLEALQDGVEVSGQDAFTLVRSQTRHLVRLVNDLEILALADADELALHLRPVELSDWLAERLPTYRAAAQQHGLDFRATVAAELPSLACDPDRLAQALGNLIDNAVKYTPGGGSVDVAIERSGDRVRFQVHDTGIGIDPKHFPHLFDRLYRTDPARARDTGGAGLGLAIAKKFVDLHGGHLGVNSSPGQGSTFWFDIPLSRASS